jgi:hypothetical protein
MDGKERVLPFLIPVCPSPGDEIPGAVIDAHRRGEIDVA